MKKRFLSIVLTVVMVLALAVPALAVTETELWHESYEDFSGSLQLIKVFHNGFYGYVNYNGQVVVQEKYTQLEDFSEGLALAWRDNVAMFVNAAGQEVITLGACEEAYSFSSGRAKFVKDGNTYFCDNTGKVVINLGKTWASNFDGNGLALIRNKEGKYGLINTNNAHAAHVIYDVIRPFSEGLAYFKRTDANGVVTQGFLSLGGAEVIHVPSYLIVSDFSDGMAKVENPSADLLNRIGYIDRSGYQAVACQYEYGDDFADGVARIRRNGKWGYIDKINRYTVQPEYDELDAGTGIVRAAKIFADTVASGQTIGVEDQHLVLVDNSAQTVPYLHWGFVNVKSGAVVVPLIYTAARPFSEGLAQVELWGNIGFVNTNAQVVINCGKKYERIGDMHEGKAWVVKNDKYGYIGAYNDGREVIPLIFDIDREQGMPAYTGLSNFNKGFAAACTGNVKSGEYSRYGVINASGNWVISNKYTWIDAFQTNDLIMLARYGGYRTHILNLR